MVITPNMASFDVDKYTIKFLNKAFMLKYIVSMSKVRPLDLQSEIYEFKYYLCG